MASDAALIKLLARSMDQAARVSVGDDMAYLERLASVPTAKMSLRGALLALQAMKSMRSKLEALFGSFSYSFSEGLFKDPQVSIKICDTYLVVSWGLLVTPISALLDVICWFSEF